MIDITIRVQNLSKCYQVCSRPVYHFLHPEPVDFRQDPLALSPSSLDEGHLTRIRQSRRFYSNDQAGAFMSGIQA